MTLSHDELYRSQSGEPTGLRAWQPVKYVVYTGLKHMHSHYGSNGFPIICAASAFPSSPKRGTELDCG